MEVMQNEMVVAILGKLISFSISFRQIDFFWCSIVLPWKLEVVYPSIFASNFQGILIFDSCNFRGSSVFVLKYLHDHILSLFDLHQWVKIRIIHLL